MATCMMSQASHQELQACTQLRLHDVVVEVNCNAWLLLPIAALMQMQRAPSSPATVILRCQNAQGRVK